MYDQLVSFLGGLGSQAASYLSERDRELYSSLAGALVILTGLVVRRIFFRPYHFSELGEVVCRCLQKCIDHPKSLDDYNGCPRAILNPKDHHAEKKISLWKHENDGWKLHVNDVDAVPYLKGGKREFRAIRKVLYKVRDELRRKLAQDKARRDRQELGI